MRVDSCKSCGEQLQVSQTCEICNQPSSFTCSKCKKEEDQFHLKCTLSSFSHALLKAFNAKTNK